MRTPLIAIAAVSWSLLAVVSTSHAQDRGPTQPEAGQDKKDIAVVRGFWRDMWLGRDGSAAPKYIAETYTEHFVGATNGRADLVRRLGHPAPPGAPQQKVVSQTVYAHSPYVALLQEREITDPKQSGKIRRINTIEMLTVYDGLIQEHRMFFPEGHLPANRPQTEQEEKNITAVKGFWSQMWTPRNGSVAPQYLAWGYIEHGNGHENATNGRADMVLRFGHPLPAGAPGMKVVSQTVYANGPIVLVLQDRVGPDPRAPAKIRNMNVIAMFEVYDGLLQEHWLLLPQEQGVW